jgi:hypothetical protein
MTVGTIMVIILVLVVLGVGVILGMLAANEHFEERRAKLAEREAQLRSAWDALQAQQRINWAFFRAREALRQEARRWRDEPGGRS